ncbi:MAG TPA: Nif3-like dinuclear metal center hexameric protein [Chthonomonadaceae bacterium]|nr:Nif3-like dinuclear metal center hexameric protein [Chthonomonadaceae bacterium]
MTRKPADNPEDIPRRRRRRAVTVAEILDFLEYLAPPSLASPPAPSGLQVGTAFTPVKNIVVTPLATYNAISCAAVYKAALIICAAPLLAGPLTELRWDNPIGAKVAHLVQRQISLYILSNAYAAAPGGFDDSLAERLGLAVSGALVPTAAEVQLKLVVFVPLESVERVQKAASEAGAGIIGNYTNCAFRSPGTGTFLPHEGANPAIGQVGKLEEVEEIRLEMLVPERELQGVVAAVLEAHPYEEVAYDIYPLRNPGVVYGRGRIGELPLGVSLDTVLAQVNDALTLTAENPARCSHRPSQPIRSLAVASGMSAGESLLWAAHRQGAGALVTGGATLTDLMLADSTDTVLIDVGFAPSVAPGLQRLVAQLRDTFDSDGMHVLYVP